MCSSHRPLNGADSYDITDATSDALQESPRQFAVLMDVNKWDPDEGRAWITVSAVNALDAMDQVRVMYPSAAVLMAEVAE